MRRYLRDRLLQAVGVVFLVTTLTFLLVHLAPGDPLNAALDRPGVTEEIRAQWRQQFGLDRPIGEQYVRWIVNVPRGELGYSFSHRRPVRDVLLDAMPRTLLLVGLALALSFALGVAVGVLQAERVGSPRDRWLGRGLLLLYSVPDFWLALLALLLFAYRLPILPPGGIVDPVLHDYLPFGRRVLDRLAHLVLPVVTLALLTSAVIARHQRSSLLAVLPSDWMRTALAKGLRWRDAVRRHALRNALLSTITLFGLSLPAMAGGAVFVEKVFSWPGMGMVTVNAIGARDYPLITAGVLVISVAVAVGALVADLAVAAADPRIRMQ
ncbi:MAG: ABC transporter permease [Gemmatimonadaceae bacterium]|nr:ABC transporter permease [Gemmatimonadaceae bacterium]NUO94804.1 ABC transporter permease [Gemmatimonadaceae bacterium]NUP72900.1 ABC transporter permease [Gemmatimonadaceae bacterium]NUR35636.1 ABC transporter permease [Gemmatimonadaceae bacterium]NUS32488.1 ABC transporter permease [Gemmatimonadaceae bacterium]